MPSKHSPGYNRWFQRIQRQATRRLIARHRAEYEANLEEFKRLEPRETVAS